MNSTAIQQEGFDVRGPSAATTFNIACTNTSAAIDLSGANYTGLASALAAGRMVTLKADGGKVWYRWAAATGTVDETTTAASTPANQGVSIADGERVDERPPAGCSGWLIVKSSVACTLRVYVSSVNPAVFVGA